MDNIAQSIKEKALDLGYEKCGIIKISEVADYSEKLRERMSRVSLGKMQYGQFQSLAEPAKAYPWAKSIIVLVSSYAGYNVPAGFEGVYGKAYLFDGRIDKNSFDYKARQQFGDFLNLQGLKTATEPKFSLTAVRWAAFKAGLGQIRKNNFFFTENGSWNKIEAWLIDRELELVEHPDLKECPKNCNKCIEACPTNSLSRPYTMSLLKCVSFITSMSVEKGMGTPSLKTAATVGCRLYGCDTCQDVCPHNAGKWRGGEDFPGLNELSEYMRPEKIMAISYEEIANTLAPKFWYISPENLWKWKINALSFMKNDFKAEYIESIKSGMADSNRRVRSFAKKVCVALKI